jgi:hypothetical protein
MINKIKKIPAYISKFGFKKTVKNALYAFFYRKKTKHFGTLNPDVTFYVIRPINSDSRFYTGPVHNLLANFFYVLSHLKFARDNNYVPIVDMENYKVYNSLDEPINDTKNAWEYFFCQPFQSKPLQSKLNEIYKSKNVILSKCSWFSQWDMGYDVNNYQNKDIIALYSSPAPKLNSQTENAVAESYIQVFGERKGILGVSYRFGGHSKECLRVGAGHPIQPEVAELIDITEKNLNLLNLKYVFLASDEEYSVKCFQEKFGENLLLLPRIRTSKEQYATPEWFEQFYGKNSIYATSLEYLTEMELLSKCDALIGSITSGFRYAVIRNNNNYSKLVTIDNGLFARR